jgi:hypothetical protein
VRVEPGIVSTLPKNLAITGNAKDEILVRTSKTFMRDDTFVERGVPYHVMGVIYVAPNVDAAPVTMTVEPGVTLAFETDVGAGIRIGSSDARHGILNAVGTDTKPVVFTSAKATKAAGDWESLYFHKTPAVGSKIENARIEYAGGVATTSGAGCGPGKNDAAVFIGGLGADSTGPSIPWITKTTFENIGGTTVIVSGWIDDAGPSFAADNVFGASVPACHVSKPRRKGAGDVCDGGRDVCW